MYNKIVKLVVVSGMIGCGIGDIASHSEDSTIATADNHSVDNSETGITNCSYTCEPVEDGFRVIRDCEGSQVEVGFNSLPAGDSCIIVTPDGEPTGEVVATDSSGVILNPAVS